MTLYISPENQKMLWEMIQKTPVFSLVFPSNTAIEIKTTWFKQQIQSIYDNLPSNISREQLKQINRDTLTTMLQSLKQKTNSGLSVDPHPLIDDNLLNRSFSPLKKESNINMEQIETQYRSLFDQQKPKEPDFSEKIDDEVITNMSELIEQHRKMREQELNQYGPPPQIQESPPSLAIISKEPIQPVKELVDINKRFDILEKKIDETIELFKSFIQK